jgi:hypothetical protein
MHSWDKYQKIIDENGLSSHVDKYLYYINTGDVATFFNASDLVILPYLNLIHKAVLAQQQWHTINQ